MAMYNRENAEVNRNLYGLRSGPKGLEATKKHRATGIGHRVGKMKRGPLRSRSASLNAREGI
jgi:hypothetical protein